jgi:hypothetical protein
MNIIDYLSGFKLQKPTMYDEMLKTLMNQQQKNPALQAATSALSMQAPGQRQIRDLWNNQGEMTGIPEDARQQVLQNLSNQTSANTQGTIEQATALDRQRQDALAQQVQGTLQARQQFVDAQKAQQQAARAGTVKQLVQAGGMAAGAGLGMSGVMGEGWNAVSGMTAGSGVGGFIGNFAAPGQFNIEDTMSQVNDVLSAFDQVKQSTTNQKRKEIFSDKGFMDTLFNDESQLKWILDRIKLGDIEALDTVYNQYMKTSV